MRHLLLALSLFASPVCAQDNAALAQLEEELPGLVAERMVRGNLPGVAIVLVQGDDVVYARGFGRKNLAYPDPITPESVFRVASVTKQFVAFALLMLEEQGKLSLSDPVVKYAPQFRTATGDFRTITVGQLLSHHSGLPRGPYYASRHPTTAGQVEDLARMRLTYAPGSTYKYSNTGYNLAGYVAEQVAGVPLRAFMRERIMAPLGMVHSDFVLTGELASHYATGYMTDHYRSFVAPTQQLRAAPLYPAPAAAGQLYASALDVSRFLRCLLDQGKGLVKPETFRRMITPFSDQSGYGFGLGTSKRYGMDVFSHTGGYYGHSSLVIGVPSRKLGGVLFVNRASAHHENYLILDHAMARLLGVEPPELTADLDLAGTYGDGERTVDVVARGADLYLVEAGRPFLLEPYGRRTRYIAAGGSMVRWPIEFRGGRLIAGPTVLERGGEPAEAAGARAAAMKMIDPGVHPFAAYCGTYRDDDFGEAIVFLRKGELIFSFSRSEQIVLRHVEGAEFEITGGTFRGEPAIFHADSDRKIVALEAGYMRFTRGSF